MQCSISICHMKTKHSFQSIKIDFQRVSTLSVSTWPNRYPTHFTTEFQLLSFAVVLGLFNPVTQWPLYWTWSFSTFLTSLVFKYFPQNSVSHVRVKSMRFWSWMTSGRRRKLWRDVLSPDADVLSSNTDRQSLTLSPRLILSVILLHCKLLSCQMTQCSKYNQPSPAWCPFRLQLPPAWSMTWNNGICSSTTFGGHLVGWRQV